jgi:hypothetical protein
MMRNNPSLVTWFIRLTVGFVFIVNVECAMAFILHPEKYTAGFEVSGEVGNVIVQSIGILFLMWNATYPLVIFRPQSHTTLLLVILCQQAIGVIGETWLWLELPDGHTALAATGLRFIMFDSFGLLLMGLAFGLMKWTNRPNNPP